MAKKVTLADIAAKVGVSNVAVSKALSGKPGVSAQMRETIQQIADEMGYVPSGTASKAKPSGTGNIGVIVPEHYYGYSISFYGQMYERVVKALYKNKYYGILELLTKEDEKNCSLPKVMQDGKVDGLIFLGQMNEAYINKMIRQVELPVLFLDTYVPSLVFDTVISDGYYGTYMLTNYLIGQGHKRIGFVGSVDATSSIADRYWGYRRALRENRIAYKENWEIPDREESGIMYETIIRGDKFLDAYVCNCDMTAHVVIQNLEEKGYRIPEDISVVGFDNFVPAGMGMDPDRITTYEVDINRMAEVCVKTLLRKVTHQKYVEGVQLITGKIVLKKSVNRRLN